MPRGGKRTGAGRKATKLSRTEKGLKKVTAEEILAANDEQERWQSLLDATVTTSVALINSETGKEAGRETITIPDNKIRLASLMYLTDRRDGKPRQALEHTGKDNEPIIFRLIRQSQSDEPKRNLPPAETRPSA